VYWNDAKTASSVRGKLVGCHVERAKGDSLANFVYCSKGGEYREVGDRPLTSKEKGDKEIDRYVAAWNGAISGDLEAIDADIRIRCYAAIKRIQRDFMPAVQPLEAVCGVWVYGRSGCGKTSGVLKLFPNLFPKPRNIWWDGYQNEPVVCIDDLDKFDVRLGGKLKHWSDRYPFIGETKGGSIKIRPERVIVTSQYKIEEIWEDLETQEALKRRFFFIFCEENVPLIIN
jgi:hypothetical protein